jgi:hypothetical protein
MQVQFYHFYFSDVLSNLKFMFAATDRDGDFAGIKLNVSTARRAITPYDLPILHQDHIRFG